MPRVLARILRGEFEPGDFLPKEEDFADAFSVSRGVARECRQGLEDRGVVTVKHGKGAIVQPQARWNVFDGVVFEALLAGPDGRDFLRETMAARAVVAAEVAALAATRGDEQQRAAIAAALAELGRIPKPGALDEERLERYRLAEIGFHDALARAAGNRPLRRLALPVTEVLAGRAARPADRRRLLATREAIASAVDAGDADRARAAAIAHVDALALALGAA